MPAPLDALSAQAICHAVAELPLELTSSQCEQLALFAQLLLKWNTTYNLTSIETPEQVLTHHLLDSLSIVTALQDVMARNGPAVSGGVLDRANRVAGVAGPNVLDVGSGGGLPGIPLAIALPHWRFTLMDAVGKKTAFITQAKLALGLANVTVIHGRVETCADHNADVIVSRAFASVGDFVRLTQAARAPLGIWAAMKGSAQCDSDLPDHVYVDQVIELSVPRLSAHRHLLVIRARPQTLT